jgi:chromosome segregation ATPase
VSTPVFESSDIELAFKLAAATMRATHVTTLEQEKSGVWHGYYAGQLKFDSLATLTTPLKDLLIEKIKAAGDNPYPLSLPVILHDTTNGKPYLANIYITPELITCSLTDCCKDDDAHDAQNRIQLAAAIKHACEQLANELLAPPLQEDAPIDESVRTQVNDCEIITTSDNFERTKRGDAVLRLSELALRQSFHSNAVTSLQDDASPSERAELFLVVGFPEKGFKTGLISPTQPGYLELEADAPTFVKFEKRAGSKIRSMQDSEHEGRTTVIETKDSGPESYLAYSEATPDGSKYDTCFSRIGTIDDYMFSAAWSLFLMMCDKAGVLPDERSNPDIIRNTYQLGIDVAAADDDGHAFTPEELTKLDPAKLARSEKELAALERFLGMFGVLQVNDKTLNLTPPDRPSTPARISASPVPVIVDTRVTELEAQLAALALERDELKELNATLKKENTALKAKQADYDELVKLNQTLQTDLQQASINIDKLTEELQQARTDIQELTEKLSTKDEQIAAYQHKETQGLAKIDELELRLRQQQEAFDTQYEQHLKEAHALEDTLRDQISALSTKKSELIDEKRAAQAKALELAEEKSRLLIGIGDLEQSLFQKSSAYTLLETQHRKLGDTLKQKDTKIKGLQKDLRRAEEHLAQQQDEHASEVEQLTRHAKTADSRRLEIRQELDGANTELTTLREELARLKDVDSHAESLVSQLSNATRLADGLQIELTAAVTRATDAEQRLAELEVVNSAAQDAASTHRREMLQYTVGLENERAELLESLDEEKVLLTEQFEEEKVRLTKQLEAERETVRLLTTELATERETTGDLRQQLEAQRLAAETARSALETKEQEHLLLVNGLEERLAAAVADKLKAEVTLDKAHEKFVTRLGTSEGTVIDLRQRLDAASQHNTELLDINSDLKEQLASAQQDRSAAEKELTQLQASLQTKSEEVASLQEQLSEQSTSSAAAIDELGRELAGITSIHELETESLSTQLRQATKDRAAEISRFESQLAAASSELAATEELLSAAQTKVLPHKSELAEAQVRVTTLEEEAALLSLQVADKERALVLLQAALDAKGGELSRATTRLTEQEARLSQQAAALTLQEHELTEKGGTLQEQERTHKEALAALEQRLGTEKTEALERQAQDYQLSLVDLPSRGSFDEVTSQLDATKAKLGTKTEEALQLKRELAKAKSKLETAKQAHHGELEALRTEAHAQTSEVDELKLENAKLVRQSTQASPIADPQELQELKDEVSRLAKAQTHLKGELKPLRAKAEKVDALEHADTKRTAELESAVQELSKLEATRQALQKEVDKLSPQVTTLTSHLEDDRQAYSKETERHLAAEDRIKAEARETQGDLQTQITTLTGTVTALSQKLKHIQALIKTQTLLDIIHERISNLPDSDDKTSPELLKLMGMKAAIKVATTPGARQKNRERFIKACAPFLAKDKASDFQTQLSVQMRNPSLKTRVKTRVGLYSSNFNFETCRRIFHDAHTALEAADESSVESFAPVKIKHHHEGRLGTKDKELRITSAQEAAAYFYGMTRTPEQLADEVLALGVPQAPAMTLVT